MGDESTRRAVVSTLGAMSAPTSSRRRSTAHHRAGARRTHRTVRHRARDPPHAGPHPRIDQHRRSRRGGDPLRGAHWRHAVHRRCRPTGSAFVPRRHERGTRRNALRLAPRATPHAPRPDPGIPRARRRVVVRKEPLDRDVVDHRRSARIELLACTTDEGRVRCRGDRGPDRTSGVFLLRREPQSREPRHPRRVGCALSPGVTPNSQAVCFSLVRRSSW